MICIQLDKKFDWFVLGYGLLYPMLMVECGLMEVGQNRETDEEHDKDCIEEGFQLARVKWGNRSINRSSFTIWCFEYIDFYNFLVMETFSNIFCSNFCWGR